MASNKPVIHGKDHSPGGADTNFTAPWHKAGDTDEPAFQNGWTGRFWFKLVIGPYSQLLQSMEVVLAVDNGTSGSVIVTVPAAYVAWAGGEKIPGNGHDQQGLFRAFHIDGATGDVIDGPIP